MKNDCTFSFGQMLKVVLITALMVLLSGCDVLKPGTSSPSIVILTRSTGPFELSITEIPLERAEPYFQDPISQEKMNGIASITQSGIKSVHVLARSGPGNDDLTSGVYAILEPGQELMGYLRLINTLDYAHDFGMLVTLDYLPIQTQFNDNVQDFPKVHLEPGTQRAFRFSLSALPEGLHTLVITLINEPDHFFSFDPNPEQFDPAENEAMGLRGSPFEFGVLMWVTSQNPQNVLDWPEQARYIAPEKTTLLMEATLLKEKPAPGEPGKIFLNKDIVQAGETVTYYARFAAPKSASADIPMRILVLWDEVPTQTDELSVPVETAIENDYIPYGIRVPANLSEGEHTLTVVAYPYPYYLRWWKDGSEWHPESGLFSIPMARLPVTVKTP